MTTLHSQEFEWRRINAELYQLHARLSRATATRPEEAEQFRAMIRILDEASVKVQAEIELLREDRRPDAAKRHASLLRATTTRVRRRPARQVHSPGKTTRRRARD